MTPKFKFGDKVNCEGNKGIFVTYSMESAFILFMGEMEVDLVAICFVSKGWTK